MHWGVPLVDSGFFENFLDVAVYMADAQVLPIAADRRFG